MAVPLDVTDDDSVRDAFRTVEDHPKYQSLGLVGVINCAGVGYNGPSEYFPLDLYRRQIDINCLGYVRVMQAAMPLLRASAEAGGTAAGRKDGKDEEDAAVPPRRRGRVAFLGTGGGACSPLPPLLSAYMASKFAVEAVCGCLRLEMQLTHRPIDVCMVNPGFVKPTNLMAGGLELTRRMWEECEKLQGDNRARDEYGSLLEAFVRYSEAQPGTHVSRVADAVLELMEANRPLSSYKVGPDSKAAPFVGMMPTGVREFIVKYSMFGEVGTV